MRRLKAHHYCALVLVIGTMLGLSACDSSDAMTTLRVAHPMEAIHPNNLALQFLADDLHARSNGQMAVELYSGGQLGSDRECLELLQIGSLDMTITSAAVVEAFVPEFKIFGLPYLFESRAQRLEKLAGDFGRKLLQSGVPYRLRGMAYFDAGSRSFYTKDGVVRSPDDLVGKKIRVLPSPMAIRTVRALGASPTPISWGELYTALQQGVVDAAENNPPSLVTSRHYEITPFFSPDEHSAIPDVLIMGESSWQRLSEQEQAWLMDSVEAATAHQSTLWAQAENNALETLEEQDVTIFRPDKEPFMKAVEPLYLDFKKSDPKLYQLVEEIRQP